LVRLLLAVRDTTRREDTCMKGRCEVCGNQYDGAMEIVLRGERHVFDCFECAIHSLAPRCAHCACAIIGHGIESEGTMYCCAHCAHEQGVAGARDHV
jgi:hypothetical protein